MIAAAAARLGSFADAAFALELAGLPLSLQHVRTLALEVGEDLAQQRDAQAARGRRRLPVRVTPTPDLVAVEVDGGRLRHPPPTRERAFTTRKTRRTRSPVWSRSKGRCSGRIRNRSRQSRSCNRGASGARHGLQADSVVPKIG